MDALKKLAIVLSGNLATHQPLPGTEQFILECLVRKCQFLSAAGFREKAVASLQALVEFNFFHPEEIKNMPPDEKKHFFEPFWDSGKPRFGDPGAVGWKNAMLTSAEITALDSESVEKFGEMEDSVVSNGCGHSDGELWVQLERLRSSYHSVPWRSTEEPEDPDRIVLFDDISVNLVKFSDSDLRLKLLGISHKLLDTFSQVR